MKPFAPKIAGIARILALVSILANSGFTVVAHYCVMQETYCCEPSGEVLRTDCGKSLPPQSPIFAGMARDCHTDKVIGGLASNPALLQTERTTQNTKPEVASQLTLSLDPVSSSGISTGSFPSFVERASVPFVEKYVLNGSFLI